MATINTQPQETPEYRTFREHYARLYHAIQNPLSLATQLFTRSIIDSSILQQMNTLGFTTFQNTNTLLSAVLGKIQSDPRMFSVLLSALKEDAAMQLLVKSMESKCVNKFLGSPQWWQKILQIMGLNYKCVHKQESLLQLGVLRLLLKPFLTTNKRIHSFTRINCSMFHNRSKILRATLKDAMHIFVAIIYTYVRYTRLRMCVQPMSLLVVTQTR